MPNHLPSHLPQRSDISQMKKSEKCVRWKSAVLLLVTASVLLLAVLAIITWKYILPTSSGGTSTRFGENIKIMSPSENFQSCANSNLGKRIIKIKL